MNLNKTYLTYSPLSFTGRGLFIVFFLSLFILISPETQAQETKEKVELRAFDEEKRQELVDNPAYLYGRDKLRNKKLENAGAENRAQKGLSDFWFRNRVGRTSLIEIILYVLGIIGLIFFLLTFLKVDVRGVFVKNAKKISLNLEELGDNLEDLDFDGLIKQARKNGDFRSAVRLTYLETLKILTAAGHIRWKINKTNQDYLGELRLTRFRDEFAALTLSYEYVWYGDRQIDELGFDAMEKTFRSFQQNLP